MASGNTSGLSSGTAGHDDSESENEVFFNPRTYDRQSEGTERSENVAAMTTGVGSSTIAPETDRMAASYLLQLRDAKSQSQTEQAPTIPSSSRCQHVVPPGNSNANPSPSLHTGMPNANLANQSRFAPQDMMHSETNMKNTVVGLSNVIAIMQQQQVGLQQQQACMELKQDSISNSLINVTSLLQDLANKAQNSSQNSCTDGVQNGGQRLTDVPRVEQNVSLQDRAGGDQSTTRGAQDMTLGSNTTTVNTALPEDRRSAASQRYLEYDWENREGQTCSTHYEGTGSSYPEDTCLYRNYDDQRGLHRVHWGEQEYNSSEHRTENLPHSRRQESREFNEVKLPPFNGKEDWKVWVSRFETVAERRGWSDDKKLDNLIPKLQGKAGEFVFTQLPRGTLSCYSELIKELNSLVQSC